MIFLRINSVSYGLNDANYTGLRESTDTTILKDIGHVEKNPTLMQFKEVVGEEDFEKLVDNFKDITSELKYTKLEFSIHDDTNRIMVKVLDKTNDEVIAEIPPEKLLDILAGLWKLAEFIVDERV